MSPSDPVRRRAVLSGAAGLFAGLGGCSSRFGRSSESGNGRPPPLGRITLLNYYEEPKRVELVVEDDGRIVHRDAHEVPEAERSDGRLETIGRVEVSTGEWTGCRVDEIRVRLRDEPQRTALDLRDSGPSKANGREATPVGVTVEFGPDGIFTHLTQLERARYRCALGTGASEPQPGRKAANAVGDDGFETQRVYKRI